jgi:hypothetical protein
MSSRIQGSSTADLIYQVARGRKGSFQLDALGHVLRIQWGGFFHMKRLWQLILALTLGLTVCVAQDVVSIVHGTVKKVDKSTKTLVVKAADGTEHTI